MAEWFWPIYLAVGGVVEMFSPLTDWSVMNGHVEGVVAFLLFIVEHLIAQAHGCWSAIAC